MWKEIAFGVAMLAAASPAAGAPAFKPVCRDGTVADSRADPAWLRESFAHDNCHAPAPPVVPDGARASRAQIVAGMAAARAYDSATAAFRKCVAGRVAAGPLTPFERIIENQRLKASSRSAGAAQARMRAAVVAFNAYGSGCDDP